MSNMYIHVCSAVVPKVCSADPKGSMTSSQRLCEYVFVMAALKLNNFFTYRNNVY
jgi:hypothetical protein